jgi:16S rRNA processing protein RimM
MNFEDGSWILMAAITAAHGLDGSVKLKLFSDDPASLKRTKMFSTDRRIILSLKSSRTQSGMVIARFDEIPDRTAAEQWRGAKLYMLRADLPVPSDDEIYHIDLIGMCVVTPDTAIIGTVIDIPNYGAGDLLDIKQADGKTILVPYRDVAVLNLDTANRRITIDPAFLE